MEWGICQSTHPSMFIEICDQLYFDVMASLEHYIKY